MSASARWLILVAAIGCGDNVAAPDVEPCGVGYTGDGRTCIDIDECTAGTDNCDSNATCTNMPGSFTCACDAGFTGNSGTCTDIDECTAGTDNCDANATCTNTTGSFTCACDAGFTGNGVTCTDIDECFESTDNCDANATCTNIPGSFTCACDAGYAGDGVSCADIDECIAGSDNCDFHATCTNTTGSFTCACDAGYAGDGVSCADVDECFDGTDNCHANATCTNIPGSFSCTCDAGYAGDGVSCADIDECFDGTDNCDVHATCANTVGSFTCACDAGFTGDGVACADVDECTAGTDNCDLHATCTNTTGSFTCACDAGFTGNGLVCFAGPPRQLKPLSTAIVTSRRPTLRWVPAPGTDGTVVELCRDRACTMLIETLDVAGTGAAPTADLPSGVVFWRLHGRTGTTVDPATSATWQFTVGKLGAPIDTSWGTVLDVDGDGRGDIAVGAIGNGGRVHVYRGGTTVGPAPTTSVTGPDGGLFGLLVTSAGDVNGDGYSDVLVGAPHVGPSDPVSGVGTGRAYLYLGGATGLATSPATTLVAQDGAGSGFGWAGAGIGDVNGDGYADIAVGAPATYSTTLPGSVYIYLGGPTGLAISPVASFVGPNGAGGAFGFELASAGDLDGDGYEDLAIGGPYQPQPIFGSTAGGRAFVYRGTASGFTTPPKVLSVVGYGWFARALTAADFNGDGYADLVVASGSTAVSVYAGGPAGIPNTPTRSIEGAGANGLAGYGGALGAAGDVDGNGYADLIIGNTNVTAFNSVTGAAFMYLGSASGLSATPAWLQDGQFPLSSFGTSVAGVGDVDRDGYDDVAIGSPGIEAVYVYRGKASWSCGCVDRSWNPRLNGPDGQGNFFGASVGGSSMY